MLRFKGRFMCLMLTVFVLLTGCSHSESADLTMQFDKEGNYTGFSNISDLSKYKSVTALRDGCYVCKDNSYSGGRPCWTTQRLSRAAPAVLYSFMKMIHCPR